ncbi:MAG: NTP transferase domain-containing protein [Bacteroidota bacterium]
MIGNIKTPAFPVVILAAGLSERMGLMKPLLKFNEKEIFLSHIIAEYEKLGSQEIIIVTNETVVNEIDKTSLRNAEIVINKNPASGRLHSIKIGLNLLKTKNACFIHNTDNPFVNQPLLHKMTLSVNDNNIVVPVYKGKGGHPILIGRKVIEHICKQKQTDADLRELLKYFERINVQTTDEKILCNINSMEDYNKYF